MRKKKKLFSLLARELRVEWVRAFHIRLLTGVKLKCSYIRNKQKQNQEEGLLIAQNVVPRLRNKFDRYKSFDKTFDFDIFGWVLLILSVCKIFLERRYVRALKCRKFKKVFEGFSDTRGVKTLNRIGLINCLWMLSAKINFFKILWWLIISRELKRWKKIKMFYWNARQMEFPVLT